MPTQHRASTPPPAKSYRLAAFDRFFVVEWVGTPRAADVDHVVESFASHAERRGRQKCFVVIVSSSASMPDHEGRLSYIRNVDRTMLHCERMQIVLAGMPFINAFARGLVTTANVVPRYRGRVLVQSSLGECVDALSPDVGRTADELQRVIASTLA